MQISLIGLAPPAPAFDLGLPEPLASLVHWAFALQRHLNGEMRAHLADMTDGVTWQPFSAVILAAFLYGVFHAVGPGHGKVVIGSWFATRRARVVHGLAACFLSAGVQAVSAIVLVGLTAGLASLGPRSVMAQAAWIEAASFALIAMVGAWMLVQALRGAQTCGHDHSHDHHAGCAHHHHHHHDEAKERRSLWAMAAAVGFRPCSGAILILLFTLGNSMAWVGIAATFAMALGVGLTVSGIGLSALSLNRLLDRGGAQSRRATWLRKAASILGACVVLAVGLILTASVIQNGPALTG